VSKLCDDKFYTVLTGPFGYLRRQQFLLASMKATCPTVASARWLSLARVTRWLFKHRLRVPEYLELMRPLCTPPSPWWVALIAVIAFMEPVDICFYKLQGLTTIISEQDGNLMNLASTLRLLVVVEGPLTAEQILSKKNDEQMIVVEELATSRFSLRNFIADLGMFVYSTYNSLLPEDANSVEIGVEKMFVAAAEKISSFCAERNATRHRVMIGFPPSFRMSLPPCILESST
jgi:hypothetical protein